MASRGSSRPHGLRVATVRIRPLATAATRQTASHRQVHLVCARIAVEELWCRVAVAAVPRDSSFFAVGRRATSRSRTQQSCHRHRPHKPLKQTDTTTRPSCRASPEHQLPEPAGLRALIPVPVPDASWAQIGSVASATVSASISQALRTRLREVDLIAGGFRSVGESACGHWVGSGRAG